MFGIYIAENTDTNGNCEDYYQAYDEEKDIPLIFGDVNEAIKYVIDQCGNFAPFKGKYTYHIWEMKTTEEPFADVDVDWGLAKQVMINA